jgi:NAD(P)-dependent dehydrogenase (short-subunit alcohol dehydrogenase family)
MMLILAEDKFRDLIYPALDGSNRQSLHEKKTGIILLQDKVVIVTGAGSGLGRALSLAFCREGAKVIGLSRSLNSLQETQSLVNQAGYDSFSFNQIDISDFDELQKVVDNIVDAQGRIDYLFNNAAVYPKVNFLDESAEDFLQAININVAGMANACKAVLPIMIKNQVGRIYNLGSWADLSPITNSAAYSASKGAVHALTKAIAADIAHYQVDVQVHEWVPGHLNTQMSDYTGMDPAVSAGYGVMLAQRQNEKKNCIFDRDEEWLPPKSLRKKIKSKLLFWKK